MAARKLFLVVNAIILVLAICFASTNAASVCNVKAQTDAGWICGLRRTAENGAEYASFRGVPYAKQPLGELRFKELQPAEPWDYLKETIDEGPVCPQNDVIYGPLMQPRSMSEECIHANVHVPIQALPGNEKCNQIPLPILVYIHGGGFASGSGDADVNGPEYLVGQDVIVITFNYRLNVFGFLSLNSSSIPGNNGLRDQVTLLRWVQKNAAYFGGNPDDVTIMGQSAGSSSVHLLSLSKACSGLFKRLILLSGEADRSFFTASQTHAQTAANSFLQLVGINSTDPEKIHSQLVAMPLEQIMSANKQLQTGALLSVFWPVVEMEFSGVTRIIDANPANLIQQGRGTDFPMLVGFTNAECETVRSRVVSLDVLSLVKADPKNFLSPDLLFSLSAEEAVEEGNNIQAKFLPEETLEEYMSYCTISFFHHSAISLAQRRAELGAPVYMYEFAYNAESSVVKKALNLTFTGAGHIEDLTYILRTNSWKGSELAIPPKNEDDKMVILMTTFVKNFISCSDPTCGDSEVSWPLAEGDDLVYHYIESPSSHYSRSLTADQKNNILDFFNDIYGKGML